MLTILRAPAPAALDWSGIGEAILSLASSRLGLKRPSAAEALPDSLRQDVGLPPLHRELLHPRDLCW